MGDLNAVDLAEEMHVGVLQDSGSMQAQQTMIYPKPLPYNLEGFFEGVMIDDHVGIQVVKSSIDPLPAVQDPTGDLGVGGFPQGLASISHGPGL